MSGKTNINQNSWNGKQWLSGLLAVKVLLLMLAFVLRLSGGVQPSEAQLGASAQLDLQVCQLVVSEEGGVFRHESSNSTTERLSGVDLGIAEGLDSFSDALHLETLEYSAVSIRPSDQSIWFAQDGDIYQQANEIESSVIVLSTDFHITGLAWHSYQDVLWFSTPQKLYTFDPVSNRIQEFCTSFSSPGEIRGLDFDERGRLRLVNTEETPEYDPGVGALARKFFYNTNRPGAQVPQLVVGYQVEQAVLPVEPISSIPISSALSEPLDIVPVTEWVEQEIVFRIEGEGDFSTQDGNQLDVYQGKSSLWIGTGRNPEKSYLALRLHSEMGEQIPGTAQILSAELQLFNERNGGKQNCPDDDGGAYPCQWIRTAFTLFAEQTVEPAPFDRSQSRYPMQLDIDGLLTESYTLHNSNSKWFRYRDDGDIWRIDATPLIQELFEDGVGRDSIALIARGGLDVSPRTYLGPTYEHFLSTLDPVSCSVESSEPVVGRGWAQSLAVTPACFEQPIAISGFAWLDENGDGVRQTEEVDWPNLGIAVEQEEILVQSGPTDTSGLFHFSELEAGDYGLQASSPPEGFDFTIPSSDSAVDETRKLGIGRLYPGDHHNDIGIGLRYIGQSLTPTLQCVEALEDGSFSVRMGYENPNDFIARLPFSSLNSVDRVGKESFFPQVFLPGEHLTDFSVPLSEFPLTWQLTDTSVIVDEWSPRCVNAEDYVFRVEQNTFFQHSWESQMPPGLTMRLLADEASSEGEISLNQEQLMEYWPGETFTGEKAFFYEICDEHSCDQGRLLFDVYSVLPLQAVDFSLVTLEDTPVMLGEVAEEILTINAERQANELLFEMVSAQTEQEGLFEHINFDQFRYTPPVNFSGKDEAWYEVCDSRGCSLGRVQISVLPVNDPPFIVQDLVEWELGAPVNVPVLNNDSDLDSDLDVASVQLVGVPPILGLEVSIRDNGLIRLDVAEGIDLTAWPPSFTLTYRACDVDLACGQADIVVELIVPLEPEPLSFPLSEPATDAVSQPLSEPVPTPVSTPLSLPIEPQQPIFFPIEVPEQEEDAEPVPLSTPLSVPLSASFSTPLSQAISSSLPPGGSTPLSGGNFSATSDFSDLPTSEANQPESEGVITPTTVAATAGAMVVAGASALAAAAWVLQATTNPMGMMIGGQGMSAASKVGLAKELGASYFKPDTISLDNWWGG